MAAADCTCNFKPLRLKRRAPGPDDIQIDMKYCGVCHSDVHIAQGAIAAVGGAVAYPIVPGHELSGVVTAVGSSVTKFKVRCCAAGRSRSRPRALRSSPRWLPGRVGARGGSGSARSTWVLLVKPPDT
jgi:NADPH:quinone reductase-like Zn-dependent oxidoreductase